MDASENLCDAALCGNLELIRTLLAAGADPRAEDSRALSWAAMNGHVEVVRALIGDATVFDAGCDPREYRFLGLRLEEGVIVAAGCRWLTLSESREHWTNNPDALARVERIAGWGS